MAGIIVDIQPKPIRTVYTPLNTQFNIVVVGGGSPTQFCYTNANQYIPNRALTPMKLQASLYVVDPDGVIGSGNKSSSLAVHWYENNLNKQITTGADYTVNADGSLLVKKNVAMASPVQIICRATFTDTRNGKPIISESSITLNTVPKSDERITVSIDKDVVISYNPVTDNNLIDIKASVYLGGKPAPADGCAYWWYKVTGNVEKLIGSDVTDIEYVSGQNTSTLRIDANNVEQANYRVRAAYYTGIKPSAPVDDKIVANTTFKWKLPAMRGEIFSPAGQAIQAGMTTMTFTCRIFDNKAEIANPGKHFFVKWFKKSTSPGATPVEIGHGVSITLPVSELKTTGGVQMMVYPTVRVHGSYKVLTTKNGNILTINNNKILIGF